MDCTKRLQKSWQTNPVEPVMDWTEDAELHKRYIEWKEEVESELPQVECNSLKTVQVSRLGSNEQSEHI